MFNRASQTYDCDPSSLAGMLGDEANPLTRISRLLPDGAKVLDIGAGNGLLAQLLSVDHASLTIDGIEPDPYAAGLAGKFYRKFHTGYAGEFMEQIRAEEYDFIVLADVIEHMIDPLAFMKELASVLTEKTRVVMSVPNVAFGALRISLLNGDFDYVDSGLLEKTHLRFFTLKTLEEMTRRSGLFIDQLFFLQRDIFSCEFDLEKYHTNPLLLSSILSDELSSVYQFLLVVSKQEGVTERRSFGVKTRQPLIRYLNSKLPGCFK